MTVEREQTRRDAERLLGSAGLAKRLQEHCLALLAELEQAEARIAYLEDAQQREIRARDKAAKA